MHDIISDIIDWDQANKAYLAGGGQSGERYIQRLEAADLVKRTRSTEDERQVLIALTARGQALQEKARAVPQAILAASACSVTELTAMKNQLIGLRDRLNSALGE